jgi:hypothetical protein
MHSKPTPEVIIMVQIDAKQVVPKLLQAVAYIVGAALITYNVFAVKVDKFGYYFKDQNQLWLAIGVAVFAVGLVIRNWKKL